MMGRAMNTNTGSQDRALGVFLLLAGLGAGYLFVVLPIRQALNHAAYISIFKMGAGLTPICIEMGLFFLIFGPKARTLFDHDPRSKLVSSIVALVAMMASAILFAFLPDVVIGWLGYGTLF